ncbi:hypothetical protein ABWL39_19505 [Chitinivorax sp. PXF-14]|uniref:hypothetical protein n=1 Tax=Chitinivorax sp. PXF-14 TaxID=3230488 RepID=UPI003464EFD8
MNDIDEQQPQSSDGRQVYAVRSRRQRSRTNWVVASVIVGLLLGAMGLMFSSAVHAAVEQPHLPQPH